MPVDPFTASGWQMLFAGLINGCLALGAGDLHRATWAASSLWAIVYLVIAGSLLGFTAYVWLLKNVPIAKVATYAYVNPIVALIIGCAFHGEKLDASMLAGSVVIILSVVLVTGAKVRHHPSGLPPTQDVALELEAHRTQRRLSQFRISSKISSHFTAAMSKALCPNKSGLQAASVSHDFQLLPLAERRAHGCSFIFDFIARIEFTILAEAELNSLCAPNAISAVMRSPASAFLMISPAALWKLL